MKKVIIVLLAGVICISVFINDINAQISEGGTPPSFNIRGEINEIDKVALQKIDVAAALKADEENIKNGLPHRCGISIQADIDINNSGTWTELRNNQKLWQLQIKSEGALALGLYFDDFYLPMGAKLFLYNEDKTQVIGAFTHNNNTENGLFVTEMIQGGTVTLELILPPLTTEEVHLSISDVAYFYRDVSFLFKDQDKGFGDSDASCEVNINCSPEGNNWQDEKRGAARILFLDGGSFYWCTGSLVNNVREDCTPYFLTADHCGGTASVSDMNQWMFYFNYEASGCANPGSEPSSNTIVGCTIRAHGGDGGAAGSDMLLVELNVTSIPDSYNPYYNGWNNVNTPSSSGVGIHHPAGDIKKISTYTSSLTTDDWNGSGYPSHWRLNWSATTNGHGVTEGGSSGSPLFDSNGRIVGTLTGGSSTCSNPTWSDYYGKMAYHWESNGSNADEQLKPWLDPDNTGATALGGTNQPCGNNPPTADFVASQTTVLIGGTVDFIDMSSSAESYAWIFGGGTPGSTTAVNPTITYNTVGTYDVSLTVTNTNGSDTETKTAYINVIDQQTSCDTAHYPLEGTAVIYTTAEGYFFGNNEYDMTAIAEYFSASEIVGYHQVEAALMWIYKVDGNASTPITLNVWDSDGTGGDPGTVLGTKAMTIADLSNGWNYIEFDAPITFTQPFYLGTTLPTEAQETSGDTLAYVSNTEGDTNPGSAWCIFNGSWNNYADITGGLNYRCAIFAYICPNDPDAPPIANFVGSPTTTFIGEPVDFQDLSINTPTSWNWNFSSGNPGTSAIQNPTGITWAMPGTYDVSLTATNVNGSGSETKPAYIEVREHTCEDLTTDYTMGFETTEDLWEWKIEDANDDGVSWGIYASDPNSGERAAKCYWNNDGTTASDDWLLTKCLTLEAGFNYRISFYYRVAGAAYPQQMKVMIGNAQASANMTQQIVDLGSFTNETYVQSVTEFSVSTSENYYIGFHDYSAANMYGTFLDDINIEKYNNPPVADFVSDVTEVCEGETVSFADNSENDPTSWSWSFPGGVPATSTSPNPTITYANAGTYDVTLTATNAYGSDSETKTGYITVNDNPSLTMSFTQPSCINGNNGTATVAVSGDAPPYTYQWDDPSAQTDATATGLSADTYNVTVTDNIGCSSTGSVAVTEPTALQAIISDIDHVSCYNGSDGTATVSPLGGTSDYTYLWESGSTNAQETGLSAGTYGVTVTDANNCTATNTATVNQPSQALAGIISFYTDVTCNSLDDGTATAGGTGGTSPYTYEWQTGSTDQIITGLSPGSYTVTVTDDNGCTDQATAAISEPDELIASASGTDVTCYGLNNGTANAGGSGGTSPYTYEWSTSGTDQAISGLAPGTYTVTVTDQNSCTDDASVEITQPDELVASASGTDITCYGQANGTATADATGGVTDYSYEWSTAGTDQTISGLAPDTYTVTVTDQNGCTDDASVEITQPGELVASATGTNVSCYGYDDGSATAGATGGVSTYTYEWSTNSTEQTISGLAPATYIVTVTDQNGCTDDASVEITQPDQLTLSITGTTASCFGECDATATANPSGGTGTHYYLWSNGQSGQTATDLCGDTEYTVTVTDENGCSEFDSYTPNQPGEIILQMGSVNSTCNESNGEVSVAASGGAGGFTYLWDQGSTMATVTGLPAGTYYVTVTDQDDCTATGSAGINDEGAPTLTLSHIDATCYEGDDGTATVNATGGSGNYTYLWGDPLGQTTTTATGLTANTYNVSVTDDSGCMAIGYETVGQADQITLSFTSTDPSGCDCTGEITVSASGGTGQLTYLWDHDGATTTTITELCAGTYTVTVTDENDCTATGSETITAPGAISIDPGNSTGLDCYGDTDGTVTVTASGGIPPLTYDIGDGAQSDGNFTDLAGGTYVVTVTDSEGCTAISNDLVVNEPDAISIDTEASTDVTPCFGDANGTVSIEASGGTGILTYDIGDAPQPSGSFAGLSGGTYTVTVTDENGCTATSSALTVNEPEELIIESLTYTDVTYAGGNDGTITVTASGGTGQLSYDIGSGSQSTGEFTGLTIGDYIITVTDANGCTITTDPVTISQPEALQAETSVTDETCFGACDGTATVTASGGTQPYTYEWSNNGETDASITGLCIGSYIVTVTDDIGLTVSVPTDINGPPELTVTVDITHISCFGSIDGVATAVVSGGTPEYTYEWSTGITNASIDNLTAGSYSLTVTDANGCTGTAEGIVNEPAELTASASGIDPSCFGACDGSLSATPAGGTAPYSILWDNDSTGWDVTGLCAGQYTATINDDTGCTVTTSHTLVDPDEIDIVTSGVDASCGEANGEVSVTASGGTGGYSYLWDDPLSGTTATVTGLTAGTYTVTVTDSDGCTATANAIISETGGPALIFSHNDVSCYGYDDGIAIVTAGGGTPPYTYLWEPSGQTNQAATGLSAGEYHVSVTDDIGCMTIGSVTIEQPQELLASIECTPVTCYGVCDGTATVTVSGGTGGYSYVWDNEAGTGPTVTGLCGGITYTVTITDTNGCSATAFCTPEEPEELTVNVTGTDPLCPGDCNGTATATAAGGTGELSYIWDNGAGTDPDATDLCGNITYTVIVIDVNGCTATGSFTPEGPAELSTLISGTNISCFEACDGTAEVTASGGTSPYTYLWDNDAGTDATTSDLCAGTYIVTVTDGNACTVTDTITLTEPPELIVSVSDTDPSCFGECDATAEVIASGGTPPYTYLWDNDAGTDATATDLCGGTTYTVTVTDADGCTQSSSYTPVDPDEIVLIMGSVDASCGETNGEVSVSATGGAGGFFYLWDNASSSTTATVTGLGAGTYSVTVTDSDGCIATGTTSISEIGGPEISLAFTEPFCYGTSDGTATVTITTGTPLYTYLWEPAGQTTETAAGLSAGDYFVTVTDNSTCMTIGSVTITEPDQLMISFTGTDPLCYGDCNGTIDAMATGGTGSLAYLWDDGSTDGSLTDLCASTYIVTVTDENGCTVSNSYILTDPDTLIASTVGTDPLCPGDGSGTASVNVTGGTEPYNYLWNNGQTVADPTGLYAGLYIVTVTDENGCTSIDSVEITDPDELQISAEGTMPTCYGDCDGSVTVTPSGGTGPPYLIEWYTGDTGPTINDLCEGTYSFTVTDVNSCTASSSVEVVDPDTLITTTSSTEESYTGAADGTATVTPSGGIQPYEYSWDANAGGQTDSTATGLSTGTYYVTTTDANGCTVVDSVFVDIIDVIVDIPKPDYQIYPNPTSGAVIIEMNNTCINRIEVCDMLGKSLISKDVSEDKVQLDLGSFTQGVYLIRLHSGSTVYSHKIILNLNY